MVIVCPECTTKFRINPERIPDSGAKVRCARCRTVFKATKPDSTPTAQTIFPEAPGQASSTAETSAAEERFSLDGPAETSTESSSQKAEPETDKGFSYEQFRVEKEAPEEQPAEETFSFSSAAESQEDEQFAIATDTGEDNLSGLTAQAETTAEEFSSETADAKAKVAESFTLASEPEVNEPEVNEPEVNEPEVNEPEAMPASAKAKSSPLRIMLLLVLGALLLIGVLVYLNGPEALQQFFGQQQEQPVKSGQIVLNNLEGSFISNQEAGELFVIRGEALNEFSEPRASIQVKGVIFDAEGKPLLQKTIFAGNPISDEELRSLPYSKIEELMSNQFGQSLSNMNVNTGQTIPFAIVFRNLPKSLSEFSVDVTSSQPAAK